MVAGAGDDRASGGQRVRECFRFSPEFQRRDTAIPDRIVEMTLLNTASSASCCLVTRLFRGTPLIPLTLDSPGSQAICHLLHVLRPNA